MNLSSTTDRLKATGFPLTALRVLFSLVVVATPLHAATNEAVQIRVANDLAKGKPVVVHVVVALCDNKNRGIVPVSAELGNGQDPRSNLYWGALYGVKAHFSRQGWKRVAVEKPDDERILERVLFSRTVPRGERDVPVYVVADAWDGAEIRPALQRFLAMSAGNDNEVLTIAEGSTGTEVRAGGEAHLIAYIGHNGLMDFELPKPSGSPADRSVSSSLVLACASKPYFLDYLELVDSHPLLLTTGLMAPEAYTLDAVVRAWVNGGAMEAVREAAAGAYHQYQKCGLQAARGLFWSAP